ncbi:crotonase/enoyl-CoA hydratase family protein [Allokutzneria albata]|uniref:Enoyl-CoA hydratase/carnithine racemase n=1 Tax=Allokutzneria albata TaxID=211114 RepID=A0A1H0A3F3_ALLAB|nr:crotonase/enoyl-CoA hydratase family protein [Allokutzneria albata]SDN27935.1 Enoyl-CoA hydratase/carnithine racemase [Allokutzneria albata]
MSGTALITTERRGRVLLIGFNRADKRNAFTSAMLAELATAYTELERDPELWAGVVFAHGEHFTAGLDLAEVAPKIVDTGFPLPEGSIDPWGTQGQPRTKPIVVAVQGWVLTLGIELLLASDIRIAADNSRFAQIEIKRGIYPFGGATIRFPQVAGWGNAMRWLLTGDEFDAAEALRLGLVQEVVPPGEQLDRAIDLAERICEQAPLGVRATISSARTAATEGEAAAIADLVPGLMKLMGTDDAKEGVLSFVERRKADFTGR